MTTTINASTTAGLVNTADTSGVLALQSGGTTALTASGANVTIAGTLTTAAQSIAKASLPTGSVLQVVSSTPTNITTTSNSFIDLTSQSITPTSATSQILVTVSCYFGIAGNNDRQTGYTQLLRGNTIVWGPNLGPTLGIDDPSGYHYFYSSGTFMYLDSPATTSNTTYTLQGREDSDQWSSYNSVAFILMEIAG